MQLSLFWKTSHGASAEEVSAREARHTWYVPVRIIHNHNSPVITHSALATNDHFDEFGLECDHRG